MTAEQRESVEWKSGELLVAAAAGGGKTTVLVERFVHLVVNGLADVENFPALTFTDKAAEQLKRRIRRRLEDSGAGRDILRGLDSAYISTIHSFCTRLLRENYHLADVDPSFLVIPGDESRLLKSQALDEIFEDIFASELGDSKFEGDVVELCNAYGGKDFDNTIKKQILSLYGWLMKQADPDEQLRRMADESKADPTKLEGFKEYMAMLTRQVHRLHDGYRRLEPWISATKKGGGRYAYAEKIEQALEELNDILNIDADKDTKSFIDKISGWKRPSITGSRDKDLSACSDELKDGVYKEFEDIRPRSYDAGMMEMRAAHRMTGVLVSLTKLFIKRYEQLKVRRWGLDFDDLQHRLMKMLRAHPEVAEAYRNRFKYLLIDEFQDDNRLQDAIIGSLVRPEGLFMVGDSKQAIYRFRGAEPMVYIERERRLSDATGGRLIRLGANFRSVPSICGAVNALMSELFTGGASEIDYSGGHALQASRSARDGGDAPVELHIIWKPASGRGEIRERGEDEDIDTEAAAEGPDDREAVQVEADWVAGRIEELVESGEVVVPDERGGHTAGYGDVVVLLRSMKNRTSAYSLALKRRGIPHHLAGISDFLEEQEIRDARNILRVIDNPLQDIPVASVLRSPIVGLRESVLYALRTGVGKEEFLINACRKAESVAKLEPDEMSAIARFLCLLERWRALEPRVTPSELILDVYAQTCYADYVLGLDGGRIARANLERLVDIAGQAVPAGEGGLRRFLAYLDEVEEGEIGIESGDTPDITDAVTVMTVHKAKGLEFPVVFIPDLGKKFNMADSSGDLIFDDKFGPIYKYVDTKKGYACATYDYLAGKERVRGRSLAEELRILYVAFTRAREKLIVSGNIDPKQFARLRERDADGMFVDAKTPMGWLIPALASMEGFPELAADVANPTGAGPFEVSGDFNGRWAVSSHNPSEIEKAVAHVKKDERVARMASFESLDKAGDAIPPGIEAVTMPYAYQWAVTLHDKVTAGRIAHSARISDEEDFPDDAQVAWNPEFADARGDALRTGLMLHRAYEELDFKGVEDDGWAEREAGKISTIVELPDGWDVKRFAESLRGFQDEPLIDALRGATDTRPEQAFSFKMHAGEFRGGDDPDADAEDWIMLQGRIDIAIVREGQAWLIDYKSDAVSLEGIDARIDEYIPQLKVYTEALKRAGGFDVRSFIYFIRHGKAWEITGKVADFKLGAEVYRACDAGKTDVCGGIPW